MKTNLCKKLDAVLKAARIEKKVHTQIFGKKGMGKKEAAKELVEEYRESLKKVSLPGTE